MKTYVIAVEITDTQERVDEMEEKIMDLVHEEYDEPDCKIIYAREKTDADA